MRVVVRSGAAEVHSRQSSSRSPHLSPDSRNKTELHRMKFSTIHD